MTAREPSRPEGSLSVPRRFDRSARLLGVEAMAKLAQSRVAVFGLGGVGSYAAEGLARSGVGHLTLVDFDDVCVTNINRQLHAFTSTVGKAKSDLMAERVKAINPAADVKAIKAFYDAESSDRLLTPTPDYVVDCIDNVTAKMHLIVSCIQRGIPLVTCLGASAKVDPTRVRVATLGNTHMDRLAKAVRKNLRRKHGLPETRLDDAVAVYSDEDPVWPDTEYMSDLCGVDCVCPGKDNAKHTCQKRHVIYGSAVFVTSVFGMTAASVVVGDLTGRFRHRMERNIIRERRLKRSH